MTTEERRVSKERIAVIREYGPHNIDWRWLCDEVERLQDENKQVNEFLDYLHPIAGFLLQQREKLQVQRDALLAACNGIMRVLYCTQCVGCYHCEFVTAIAQVRQEPTDIEGKDGVCCSCGYTGDVETPCNPRIDKTHCVHWWEGEEESIGTGREPEECDDVKH